MKDPSLKNTGVKGQYLINKVSRGINLVRAYASDVHIKNDAGCISETARHRGQKKNSY